MKRKIIQYIYPIILLFLVKMLTTVWVEVFLNGRKVKVYSDLFVCFANYDCLFNFCYLALG